MGLTPWDFWRLTYREFNVKHAAFSRAEDRQRSLVLEHSLVSVPGRKKQDTTRLQQMVNALRRYPVKQWLQSE